MMEVFEKIRKVRLANKMTQSEFAASLNISRSALTQLEAGNTKPSFDVLERLISNFDVDINSFFDVNREVAPPSLDHNNDEIARRVHKVKAFYDDVYGIRYNELLTEQLIRNVVKTMKEKEDKDLLWGAYKAYQFSSAFINEIDEVFIDPVKRYSNKIRKIIANREDEEASHAEAWEENADTLMEIVYSTKEFMNRVGNVYLEFYEKIRRTHSVTEDINTSALKKLLYASREHQLRSLETVLKNADALEEVEEFYGTDLGPIPDSAK